MKEVAINIYKRPIIEVAVKRHRRRNNRKGSHSQRENKQVEVALKKSRRQ